MVKVAQAGGRCCSILGQRSNAYGLVALVWFLPFFTEDKHDNQKNISVTNDLD